MSKRVWRIAPCPAYDIQGTQSWLEELAAGGLLLEKDGFFAGLFTFERAEPQALRYRLEPALQKSLWDDDKDAAKRALAAEFGWEYRATRRPFDIYRCADPAAPELNTDPALQYEAVKKVQPASGYGLLTLAVYLAVFSVRMGSFPWMGLWAATGTWYMLLALALLLAAIAGFVQQYSLLRRVRGALRRGKELTAPSPWRRGAVAHYAGLAVSAALVAAVVGGTLSIWGVSVTGDDRVPLALYTDTEPLPFVRLEALAEEGTVFTAEEWFYRGNVVQARRDFGIARVVYSEVGSFATPAGDSYSGWLEVTCVESLTPFLAQELARETYAYAVKDTSRRREMDAADLAARLGADYAMLCNDLVGRQLVLAKGERMIHLRWMLFSPQEGEDARPDENAILAIIAAALAGE